MLFEVVFTNISVQLLYGACVCVVIIWVLALFLTCGDIKLRKQGVKGRNVLVCEELFWTAFHCKYVVVHFYKWSANTLSKSDQLNSFDLI